MVRARGDRAAQFPVGSVHRCRQHVIHEVSIEDISTLVETDFLHGGDGKSLGQPAVDLAFHDHGIDHGAAIIDGDELADLVLARFGVDIHHADVGAVREGKVRRVVIGHRLQPGFHAVRDGGVGSESHLGHGLGLAGHALHLELVILPLDVRLAHLQHVGRDFLGFVADLAGGNRRSRASDRCGAAAISAQAVRRRVGVAFLHNDIGFGDSQFLGQDLGEGGFVALALGFDPEPGHHRAGGMDANFCPVIHGEAQDIELLAGARPHDLGEAGNTDAHQLAAAPFFGLLLAQLLVANGFQGDIHRLLVIPAVVFPARRGLVGELFRLDEVLLAQLHRIHVQLDRQQVHGALHNVDGLGDPERTTIGHATWCFVGVDGIHLNVGVGDIVGPRADGKQSRRPLGRAGLGVKSTVVGGGLHPQRGNLAVLGGGQFDFAVIIPGETGGLYILRAGLDPLAGPPQHQRGHRGQHVTRIDRHLVAEAASDVRRHDAGGVFLKRRDQGKDRPVGMRRLGGHKYVGAARERVVVHHAAAGFQGRRVAARVMGLLGNRHLGVLKGLFGLGLVAGLPGEDVVVLLPFLIGAQHGGTRFHGLEGIHHHRQFLVIHLHQGGAINRGGLGFGNHEGHFLGLEKHFFPGQDGLSIAGEGGHPGQVHAGQILFGQHGHHARHL